MPRQILCVSPLGASGARPSHDSVELLVKAMEARQGVNGAQQYFAIGEHPSIGRRVRGRPGHLNGAVNLELEREIDIPLIAAEVSIKGQPHFGHPLRTRHGSLKQRR